MSSPFLFGKFNGDGDDYFYMQPVFPMFLILILVGIVFVIGIVLTLILVRVFRKKNNEKPSNKNITVANIPRPTAKYFKRCPACQSTYTDESLNYCLSDGSILERTNDDSNEMETVVHRPK